MKSLCTHVSRLATAATVMVGTGIASAAQYGGGGLNAGAGDAGTVVGTSNIRTTVIEVVKKVLSFMALAAVVVIVLAGIQLVISGGNDENKERAKRIVLFAVAGLILILLARGIVEIFTTISTN